MYRIFGIMCIVGLTGSVDCTTQYRTDLQTYSAKQNTKANWDFATVFFVLIPASQISGDHEADVAMFKGTIEAIETAQSVKGC